MRPEKIAACSQSILILVGYNERPYLGDGWYGLEKGPGGMLYRASSKKAEIHVPLEGYVELSLLFSARPEHTGGLFEASVVGDAGSYFDIELAANGWSTRQGELVLDQDRPILIDTLTPWSPDTIYKNGDARSLGMLLNAVRITPIELGEAEDDYLLRLNS